MRSHQIEGSDRFIRFGVNVRFFNIEGTEDMLIDTVGMSTSASARPPVPLPRHGPQLGGKPRLQCGIVHIGHDNPIQDGKP